jgi:tetrahydromethanopterin S-methyltransferase subunit H
MFHFEKPQKVMQIGPWRVGGQPGENPTLLIGSLFHKGDALIESRKEGRFNRERAERLIRQQERLSLETGLPSMFDIVANSGDEFKAYIDFVLEVTDLPFAIDAWMLKPKLEAAQYVQELGCLDRMVYNSLNVWSEDIPKEIEAIRKIGVKHLVLVPFDGQDLLPSGRLTGLRRLLEALGDNPSETLLVDTSVMNTPAAGIASWANYQIKKEFGLPVGNAPANGSYMWKEAKALWGKEGFAAVDAVLHGLCGLLWSDFLFYGPLTGAGRIFPAVAVANALLATIRFAQESQLPTGRDHPLQKLLSDFVQKLEKRS